MMNNCYAKIFKIFKFIIGIIGFRPGRSISGQLKKKDES